LPDALKASHVEPDAGHYGIFAGRAWRDNIRPLVIDFMNANSGRSAVKKTVKRASKKLAKTANKNAA